MVSFSDLKNKSFSKEEEHILNFWDRIDIFIRSVEKNDDSRGLNNYVFYDGPPFATGLPHYGHFVASTIKDIVPRYWTMRGKKVKREFGWDTHGLPVEMEVEKKLGLSGPTAIKKYGIEKFNEACRASVLRYTKDWKKTLIRLGRWVDFDNDYKTMDLSFMESVWWGFGELWKSGLIYQSFKVMPYSYRLSTPLSNFEANLDYRYVQDPAITVKFSIENDIDNAKLLIWTTTPWTLPSNLAIAVGENIEYVKVKKNNEVFIVAKNKLYDILGNDIQILSKLTGNQLIGLTYKPLFPYFSNQKNAFKIVSSSYVNTKNGTGLVHIAPAYGVDDFKICKKANIDIVDPVDEEGNFKKIISDFAYINIKDADSKIIYKLKRNGSILKHETLHHSYPFCWRSGQPLIYKAVPVWMVSVDKIKQKMIEHNHNIHWVPESIGKKRFGNWLKDAEDWNISRNRFWGTPIPIWQCKNCNKNLCISSIDELEMHTKSKVLDLHSHNIDCLKFSCNICGQDMKRISEVFDCWFDAGSMFYSKVHYPFENKKNFNSFFPADFIAEGLDQTRGWFYTLLVLSTALFNKSPFKNVIVNGLVLAKDGSKMSKSKQNFPDPNKILKVYGADALRIYLINSPVVRGDPFVFSEKGVKDIIRAVMLPLYNSWFFFVQYANIDSWIPLKDFKNAPKLYYRPEIDRWIISKLQSLVKEINFQMENYYLYKVIPPMLEFINDLTNWYIRCSRRRFWKNAKIKADFIDKSSAYATLYEVLTTFCKVLAPISPFITERMYQNLVVEAKMFKIGEDSVHLCSYPKVNLNKIDKKLENNVDITRKIISMGRALREKYCIKIRQPIFAVIIVTDNIDIIKAISEHKKNIISELNIKEVKIIDNDTLLCEIKFKANFKTLGKRMGKHMKEAAKIISQFTKQKFEKLKSGNEIIVCGKNIILKDVLLIRKAKKNVIIESSNNLTVALDIKYSEKLILEGLARELVSCIQKIRKDKNFNITDRVKIVLYSNSEKIFNVFQSFKVYIKEEVLALDFEFINTLKLFNGVSIKIDNENIFIDIKKI